MNTKEKRLVFYLYDHKNRYVNSQELSKVLSLSDRTVRTYIQRLRSTLNYNGANILSKTGYGHKFEITDKNKFDNFAYSRDIFEHKGETSHDLNETKNRQNYILNKLLLEEKSVLLDDLEQKLFVSRSTLTSDLKKIRKILKPFSLSIKSKPSFGLWISGTEKNKRHFIMNYFFGDFYSYSMQKYLGSSEYFDDISLDELIVIILEECRENELKLSDFIIQNIVLHLALSIKRSREGFEITDLGIDFSNENHKELCVSQKIIFRVQEAFHVDFPKEEISYLALHLMAKSNQPEAEIIKDDQLSNNIESILKLIQTESGFPIVDDSNLKMGLLDHIKPMLVRLQRGISIKNPLLSEIKEDYPEVLSLVRRCMENLPELIDYDVIDDEWAYLTLHFLAAFEKYQTQKKIKALVICATGIGSAQLLKVRINKEFGKYINITDVMGYFEIDKNNLDDIDLIISSVDLSTIVPNVPVVHVSIFLNEKDITNIRNQIGKFSVKKFEKKISNNISIESNLKKIEVFDKFMSRDYFIKYSTTMEKNGVLSDLINCLKVNESDSYETSMIQQLQRREELGSIVFSETIVVPHPVIPSGERAKIGVALAPQGLIWNNENQNVQFVFLVSPSYFENEEITLITKTIVELLDRPEKQKELLNSISFDQFRQQFVEIM